MLFNSLEFFAFFAVVYGLYRALPFRGQNAMLLVAGYFFYGCWDVRFLYLIAFSTVVDFNIGLMLGTGRVPLRERLISSGFLIGAAFFALCVNWSAVLGHAGAGPLFFPDPRVDVPTLIGTVILVGLANGLYPTLLRLSPTTQRRVLLFLTVFVNLAFLGFFKYFNFFIESAEATLHAIGLNASLFRLNVVLPVGISFYTFQSLSYTLDSAKKKVEPAHHFWDFALFVAYFPPMVAGPIERARHLLPQLLRPRRIRLSQSMYGVMLILVGLFKKVAIADGIAPSVGAVFGSTGHVGAGDVAAATVLFAIQIFCDFSGYSDIAIGVSKILGIELMTNFNLPYFSRNPSEFWQRWHISLSSWLRDYLYIPLGGNRKGEARTYVNLMATMVLGGLWHGAAWSYILWGFYQGTLLCVHRAFGGKGKPRPLPTGHDAIVGHTPSHTSIPPRVPVWQRMLPPMRNALLICFFFLFVCYGWLLFRAESFAQIVLFTKTLAGFGPHGVPSILPKPTMPALLGVPLLFALQLVEYRDGRPDFLRHWPRVAQGAIFAAMVLILIMGTSNAPAQFIYFQF